jgi:hypothetical protein
MKNILFSFSILSSSLIYSINIENKEELRPLHEQKISISSLDEEAMSAHIPAFKKIKAFSKDVRTGQTGSVNEWKIAKGLIGLWVGTKLFLFGSNGVLFLLICPDHILSEIIPSSSASSSPIQKFLTNRLLWLSLSSALTASSLWILKKSISNLYEGFYGTEDTMEYFEEEYLEEDL